MTSKRKRIENQDPQTPAFLPTLFSLAESECADVIMTMTHEPMRLATITAMMPGSINDQIIDINECLDELEQSGLIKRRIDAGPPFRVLYNLTDVGMRLKLAFAALRDIRATLL